MLLSPVGTKEQKWAQACILLHVCTMYIMKKIPSNISMDSFNLHMKIKISNSSRNKVIHELLILNISYTFASLGLPYHDVAGIPNCLRNFLSPHTVTRTPSALMKGKGLSLGTRYGDRHNGPRGPAWRRGLAVRPLRLWIPEARCHRLRPLCGRKILSVSETGDKGQDSQTVMVGKHLRTERLPASLSTPA